MPDKGARHVDDPLGQAAGVHELARQDEKRHGHQHEVVGPANGVLHDDLRIELSQLQHDADAGEQQRKGDRHADGNRSEQDAQKDQRAQGVGPLPCVATCSISASMRSPRFSVMLSSASLCGCVSASQMLNAMLMPMPAPKTMAEPCSQA